MVATESDGENKCTPPTGRNDRLMEAGRHARWFELLVGELQFELRIGDAAEIRTKQQLKRKCGIHYFSTGTFFDIIHCFATFSAAVRPSRIISLTASRYAL